EGARRGEERRHGHWRPSAGGHLEGPGDLPAVPRRPLRPCQRRAKGRQDGGPGRGRHVVDGQVRRLRLDPAPGGRAGDLRRAVGQVGRAAQPIVTKGYRPEIDGLRAVAVLPVLLYHAGVEAFRGGFVGVDVFFVISGYLVTRLIRADGDAFSLRGFYE